MENMAALRKQKKLTQEELGQIVGVAQRTIAAYEAGERRPSIEVARKLGKTLDVPWVRFYDEEAKDDDGET